jgi:hypothetical protein
VLSSAPLVDAIGQNRLCIQAFDQFFVLLLSNIIAICFAGVTKMLHLCATKGWQVTGIPKTSLDQKSLLR